MDESIIYVEGRGVMDSTTAKLDKQVKEYDERLSFGMHPETKQWVVTQDVAHLSAYGKVGAKSVVVFGFGHRIPSRDEMTRKLVTTDSQRTDILKNVMDFNAGLRKAQADKLAQAQEEVAVKLEFGYRKLGSDHAHVSTRKDGKRRRLF